MTPADLEETIRRVVREEIGADELLTISGAARFSNCGKSTIREWLSTGKLLRYGKGRATRISRAEFVRFLRELGKEPDELTPEKAARHILGRDR